MHQARYATIVIAAAAASSPALATAVPSLRTDLGFTQHWSGNGLLVGGAATQRVWGVHADGGTVYATGDAGLNYSTNGGATWSYYENDSFRYQAGKVFASGSSIYTATFLGVRYSQDGGASWNTANYSNGLYTGGGVWDVWSSGSTVYAAMEYGIAISNDGGASWTSRFIERLGGGGVTGVRDVRAHGGKIYASSSLGLCTSSDGGITWQIRSLGQYSGVNGIFASDDALYVGSGNGLSVSTDGGSTWSTVWTPPSGTFGSEVHSVVRVGDTIYGSYGSQGRGGTFISVNGGTTFTRYSESAYTVFADESNAYFAGGQMLLIGSAVPAPGALALLGVAGLAGSRRRRA